MTHIEIRGARTHNLKGIDVDVPKHRLVAFTGVSGSGKSSLVFDTICTEAQRQLVETFSTYARRRLPQLTRPPVDAIRNISPCIVIDQKRLGASSRSTVGTVTEVYTYLRMLFSRCGRPHVGWSHRFSFNHPDGMCPACKGLAKRVRIDVDELLDLDRSIEEGAIRHPSYAIGKWYWREIVGSRVVPPDKPLRRFAEAEMQRLLWADGLIVRKVHQGETYERPFDGVARKLERLHVDKNEDQIPKVAREAYRRLFRERPCPASAAPGSGRLDDLLQADGATSRALQDRAAPARRDRRGFRDTLRIDDASANNLRNVSVRIPVGVLTCITGVAGSGKSSLVAELVETLRRGAEGRLGAEGNRGAEGGRGAGGRRGAVVGRGAEAVVVDQRLVGRSSRSNPATYVGVFDPIRKAFAAANRVSGAGGAAGSSPRARRKPSRRSTRSATPGAT